MLALPFGAASHYPDPQTGPSGGTRMGEGASFDIPPVAGDEVRHEVRPQGRRKGYKPCPIVRSTPEFSSGVFFYYGVLNLLPSVVGTALAQTGTSVWLSSFWFGQGQALSLRIISP